MIDVDDLELALPDADALLVVPPLAHTTWPALGPHLLQACARAAGFEVAVLYANALYARAVGPLTYAALCNAPVQWLLGDRLFARAAFGAPPLGAETSRFLAEVDALGDVRSATRYVDHLSEPVEAGESGEYRYDRATLAACEAIATRLADRLGAAIAARRYRVVGATTTFDQTAACVALLRRVKHADPDCVTILGGANCDGEMAHGVRSLDAGIDHVFAGESEASFVRFLTDLRDGAPRPGPIVRGAPCTDLDALPTPSFAEFFAQRPDVPDAPPWLLYETSRGCWWGARHHCTFCGLNAEGMTFRQKSPDRVIAELDALLAASPTRRVCLTDNIMPHTYHKTLIPRLPAEVPGLHLFYEQKANLTLQQVVALRQAGCASIQPGIEALDTALLKRIRKGVTARQNVALLRYACVAGLRLRWNLLWGFPGDEADAYARTLALIPLLVHLPPPQVFAPLHLDRFSPYYERPDEHGVSDLRPLPSYADVFPAHADLARLAYHFDAEYTSGTQDPDAPIAALADAVAAWQARWGERPPVLHVRTAGAGAYQLVDTRGLGGGTSLWLDEAMARAVLVGGPRDKVPRATWAIRNGYAADLDGWCAPLATAPVDLLQAFEAESHTRHAAA